MDKETYGILIDPSTYKAELIELNEEEVSLKRMTHILHCDYVEVDQLTNELDIWVDEEGLVNNSTELLGMFSISDSDGERLGQVTYAGRGLILTYGTSPDGRVPKGMEAKRAVQVLSSLNIGTLL